MIFEKEIKKIILTKKELFHVKEKITSIEVSNLGTGENNQSILAKINGKHKFVFRIALNKINDVEKERRKFENLKLIPNSFGPKPVLFDDSRKIIPNVFSILTFVEGKSVRKWRMKNIRLHAKALAVIHHKKFRCWTDDKKKYKKLDLLKKFDKDIDEYKQVSKDKKTSELILAVRKYILEKNQLFTSLQNFSIIHGDICNDNVVFYQNNIRYIDWEWLRIGDNAEDIGRIFSNDYSLSPWFIKLSEKNVDYMIKVYINENKNFADKTLKERVEVWNNFLKLTAMLYCKLRIKDYKQRKSRLTKAYYKNAANIIEKSLRKKFL
jgi:aminoglycoside phosphotransferase (APT) family kinase protein